VSPLHTAALASAGWAVAALAVTATRAWQRPAPAVRATPAGSAWRGVLYVFTAGMSPHAKESARLHPLIYAAGVTYHLGIVSGLVSFALVLAGTSPSNGTARALAAALAAGVASGIVLGARRAATPLLRAISAPDDYASNLLVDAWMLAAAFLWLGLGHSTPFLIASSLLGVYAPLGKIRHCVFFFLSRALYGARLGRRGHVAPAAARVPR
jgi:hypothetical protein